MSIDYVFAGLPTADLEVARAWYERFMGRPPDLIPNDNEVAWRVTETGWIYVVADADRSGSGLLTFLVDDLARWIIELEGRGLAAGEIDTIPGAVQRAVIEDPDGNSIQVGQPLR